jgi:hypothetical protein
VRLKRKSLSYHRYKAVPAFKKLEFNDEEDLLPSRDQRETSKSSSKTSLSYSSVNFVRHYRESKEFGERIIVA